MYNNDSALIVTHKTNVDMFSDTVYWSKACVPGNIDFYNYSGTLCLTTTEFYDHMSFMIRIYDTTVVKCVEINLYFMTTFDDLLPTSLEPEGGRKTQVPLYWLSVTNLNADR